MRGLAALQKNDLPVTIVFRKKILYKTEGIRGCFVKKKGRSA